MVVKSAHVALPKAFAKVKPDGQNILADWDGSKEQGTTEVEMTGQRKLFIALFVAASSAATWSRSPL